MTEQELTKNANRRLAIIRHAQEVTGNVALTWGNVDHPIWIPTLTDRC